ncbi:hypothetical protein EVAR_8740_1 [Eumeta japonica]|uniref:Uncharacterized protein n=1 Tax=Eumeta variegata TaxID=151549 RepID=A0A4C1XKR7_EUMVA|nr:hypothetical protein EVAR_8740_1 [Eumeta japonica]
MHRLKAQARQDYLQNFACISTAPRDCQSSGYSQTIFTVPGSKVHTMHTVAGHQHQDGDDSFAYEQNDDRNQCQDKVGLR